MTQVFYDVPGILPQLRERMLQHTRRTYKGSALQMPYEYPEGDPITRLRYWIKVDYEYIKSREGKVKIHPKTPLGTIFHLWQMIRYLDYPAVRFYRELRLREVDRGDLVFVWPDVNPGIEHVRKGIRAYGIARTADFMGIGTTAVQKWVRDPSTISLNRLDRLIELLGDADMCAYAVLPGSTLNYEGNLSMQLAIALAYGLGAPPCMQSRVHEDLSVGDFVLFRKYSGLDG